MAVRVRRAAPLDAAAIAAIYNEGIRGRMATFETAERSAQDVSEWFASPQPFLVAERGGADGIEVVGWIRGSGYRPRACYDGVAEFSVYVSERFRGQRIGDALMERFLTACDASGLWKVLSRVLVENKPSRALCARHGFREVGVYERHARLDGRWRDVVIVERLGGPSVDARA